MKKILVSLACAAALLPVTSSAAVDYYDNDTLSFSASSANQKVEFSWADVFGTNDSDGIFQTFEGNGKYSWKLIDLVDHSVVSSATNIGNAVTGDVNGVLKGKFYETFSGLVTGHSYNVFFDGSFKGLPGYTLTQIGDVAVTAVPEPETYAMLLAGFGLIGTMVRRRTNRA